MSSNVARCSMCGVDLGMVECPECKPRDPRWEGTSFSDSAEAAIHHALIDFTLALQTRRALRTSGTWPDESDLYIKTRRLVRDLATGKVDADEWLAAWADKTDAPETPCGCWTCRYERNPRLVMSQMVVCPECGNKRCPRATYHENACTGSNEPMQPGSRYGGLSPGTLDPSGSEPGTGGAHDD